MFTLSIFEIIHFAIEIYFINMLGFYFEFICSDFWIVPKENLFYFVETVYSIENDSENSLFKGLPAFLGKNFDW